jgi:acyl carrier protein
LLELAEPAGVALCPRCGRLFLRVCERLAVNPAEVTLSTTLAGDLGADSLDVLELLMEVEEEIGAKIPEERTREITTVGDILAIVASLDRHGR